MVWRAGLHRHRHVFAGDCARCLACWLGVARFVLAAVWHGCGHGAALSTRAPVAWDRRWLLLVAYLLQAAAIGLSLVWPGVAGLRWAAGCWACRSPPSRSLACKRRAPGVAFGGDSFTGLLTAAYGLGQIIGPPMVAWTLHCAATPSQGFTQGLVAAAAALVLGAVLYAVMVWRWPLRPAEFVGVCACSFRERQRQAQHKQAPPPRGLRNASLPLCRPAMDRTSASPRPTPPERSLAPGRR